VEVHRQPVCETHTGRDLDAIVPHMGACDQLHQTQQNFRVRQPREIADDRCEFAVKLRVKLREVLLAFGGDAAGDADARRLQSGRHSLQVQLPVHLAVGRNRGLLRAQRNCKSRQ